MDGGGIREAGIGVETLHRKGNERTGELARRVSQGISGASGLILRRDAGAYARSGLGFLDRTHVDNAVLMEVCFVNSRTDVRLCMENFEAICRSVAGSQTGDIVTPSLSFPAMPSTPCPPPSAAAGISVCWSARLGPVRKPSP